MLNRNSSYSKQLINWKFLKQKQELKEWLLYYHTLMTQAYESLLPNKHGQFLKGGKGARKIYINRSAESIASYEREPKRAENRNKGQKMAATSCTAEVLNKYGKFKEVGNQGTNGAGVKNSLSLPNKKCFSTFSRSVSTLSLLYGELVAFS